MTQEEKDKKRLEEIAEEIRNLPYTEDRVGQAFIMFNAPKPPKKQEEKRGDNTTVKER